MSALWFVFGVWFGGAGMAIYLFWRIGNGRIE